MKVDLIYKVFGSRLQNARKSAALTQQKLGERVGLSRTSVTNIERGRQHVPLHMLFVLASAVGVSPSDLLPNKESVSPTKVLRDELSRKAPLEEEGLRWLRRVIASGMDKEVDNE